LARSWVLDLRGAGIRIKSEALRAEREGVDSSIEALNALTSTRLDP
jgi:hypothetical protein